MTEPELLAGLQELPAMRTAVENLDNALALLTPEERILADLLFVHPRKNNIQRVCQLLNVESATAYRRRKQLLSKLLKVLGGMKNSQLTMDN